MKISPSSREYSGENTCIGLDFRCTKKDCGTKSTLALKTFFEFRSLPIHKIVNLIYVFSCKGSYEDARRETYDHENNRPITDEAIADTFSYMREVMMISLDNMYRDRGKIGGAGFVCEIDELKLGRRKFNTGRLVDGSWILGIVCLNTKEYRVDICPDNKRNGATLISLINKHVKKETTIVTDCWKGYDGLTANGFNHLCVNHSYNYVDPDTWANTQTIEGNWRPLRNRLSRGGLRKDDLDLHLCEYVWRKEVKNRGADGFAELIKDIIKVYPGVGY
jgi:transposase-like protein